MIYEIEKLYQKHGRYEVVCDWLRTTAYAIKNALSIRDVKAWKRREDEYSSIMEKYTPEERACFGASFKQLVDQMDNDIKNNVFKDWLGEFYMQAGIRDKDKQQEFTPYHLGKMMAELNLCEDWESKKQQEIITINDPCVGGGCLPIAFCEALKNRGFDYQRRALIVANDNDEKCVFMAYIQLSLIGAPARIIWQNTLTQEAFDEPYDTPALCMQWCKFRGFLEGVK